MKINGITEIKLYPARSIILSTALILGKKMNCLSSNLYGIAGCYDGWSITAWGSSYILMQLRKSGVHNGY
jgi:hypothetical protein